MWGVILPKYNNVLTYNWILEVHEIAECAVKLLILTFSCAERDTLIYTPYSVAKCAHFDNDINLSYTVYEPYSNTFEIKSQA